jgi:predicted aspartyl protease
MKCAWLALILAGTAYGTVRELVLPADRVSHTLILRQVYLNGQGPFRMLLDTGAASCAVRPELARRLGATGVYAVERITATGTSIAKATHLDVQVGETTDENVEALIAPVAMPGIDGILGQSWLIRHSYLLDFRKTRVVLDGPPPSGGVAIDLRAAEGRPSISAEVDGVRQELVVDSGAPALILFRAALRNARPINVVSNTGTTTGRMGTAKVAIGHTFRKSMEAAELPDRKGAGLLPASAFDSVYVSNETATVVLVPR